ncbi:MAG TPA: HEAT repeat domain-containing protein, partial [Pirellulales bacterium]
MRTQETAFSRWLGSILFVAALAWPTCVWAQPADAEPAAADAAPPDPIVDAPADEPADDAAAEDAAMEDAAMDEAGADEPALGEDQPAEPGDAPAEAAGEDAEAPVKPALPDDPAVQAVLESHPQTPAELIRAIQILADLNQAALAKPFAVELAGKKLELGQKATLADRFGSANLLRLSRNAELAPVLVPFIDDLFRSAEIFRRDADRLAAAAAQLTDPDEQIRSAAIVALVRARESAVAPLVSILADPKRAAAHPMASWVLARLGDVAVAPLVGVLECSDSALKTHVVRVLGQMRAQEATPALLGAMISPVGSPELRAEAARALGAIGGRPPMVDEALRVLETGARRALARSRDESDLTGPSVEVWHWNAARGQSEPVEYDPAAAALAEGVRLARDLFRYNPAQPANRRLYLIAALQAAKLRVGLDQPLPSGPGTSHNVAARYGTVVIEEVLSEALAQGYLPAATAAAEILGDIGDASLLVQRGATASPLALAAQHADRRVRFAATRAIMNFHPAGPFAGSSQVAAGIAFFAASYGGPRVLVVHPLSEDAQSIGGLASQLGYMPDIATSGRRAFELATTSSDYEFILIHSAIKRPNADELVAQFRRESRTRALPIGIIAPLEDWERVETYALNLPRVIPMLQ